METMVTSPSKPKTKVLEFVSKAVVSKTSGNFNVRDSFVQDTDRKVKIKIAKINNNFKSWFLAGDYLIENLEKDTILQCSKLQKLSKDIAIIMELGGEVKAETTIYEMVYLLEGQGSGEEGVLLNNGLANLFYVSDNTHILRVVSLIWYEHGWFIDAYSITDVNMWSCERQVFSRS